MTFTKSEEAYIDHEVQIRVHSEQFKLNDKRFDRIENKMNWMIGIIITGAVLPTALHYFLKL